MSQGAKQFDKGKSNEEEPPRRHRLAVDQRRDCPGERRKKRRSSHDKVVIREAESESIMSERAALFGTLNF
jgi:hypothetical protein